MQSQASYLYSNPNLYHWVMRFLYGRYFEERYRAVAAEIDQGIKIVEVCSGDAYLYRKYLKPKQVEYIGLDVSPYFVAYGVRHGVPIRKFNLWEDSIPATDVVLMQASLYQFLPNAKYIMEKMLAAARIKSYYFRARKKSYFFE